MSRWLARLTHPLEILPLVYFRIMFGGIMLWEVWRYFHHNRVVRYFIAPDFVFSYWGFEWVQPLPGNAMIWLWIALGVLSVLIALGFYYRLSMALFFLGFTYSFLIDQTHYLNHFYLVSLLSFLLIFVPAQRAWSVDAWLNPALRARTAPAWGLYALRLQLGIVYFFGGVAKLNADWLRGEPMRLWLAARTDFPLIGRFFTEEWMVYAFSYGGLLFDLLIVPLVLWRRTRWLALLLATGFHLTNARLFNIGIFPWFALAATLIFLPPEWFRPTSIPLVHRWKLRGADDADSQKAVPTETPADVTSPAEMRVENEVATTIRKKLPAIGARTWALLGLLGVYFAWQLILPLRHFTYAGDPSWTEVGHNLAWHMKLRSKRGPAQIYASDPATGFTREVPLGDYLNDRQIGQMIDNPHMLLRFAHFLTEQPEFADNEIRVWSMQSLNVRAPQLMLDPTANLAAFPYRLGNNEWVLPLLQPPQNDLGVPALLVSRRVEGALQFINITQDSFPLMWVRLEADGQLLSATDFGVATLAEGECAIAQRSEMSAPLFPICNEAASRVPPAGDADFWHGPLTLRLGDGEAVVCDAPICLLTAPER